MFVGWVWVWVRGCACERVRTCCQPVVLVHVKSVSSWSVGRQRLHRLGMSPVGGEWGSQGRAAAPGVGARVASHGCASLCRCVIGRVEWCILLENMFVHVHERVRVRADVLARELVCFVLVQVVVTGQ